VSTHVVATPKLKLAACIEWLFQPEYPDLPARIHAAHAAGLSAVELHLWRDKPLDAIERALAETGSHLSSFCAEPRSSLVNPAEHTQVLSAVRDAIPVARRFQSAKIILASGFTRADLPLEEQQAAAVKVLQQAARLAADAGTLLLLEPVNMVVNGASMFVDRIERGLDIVEEVDSPGLRLLCDVYHSAVSGENLAHALAHRMRWVGHVQFADYPGRHEPGSGSLDWPGVMALLRDQGYQGEIGLEYIPSGATLESLALTRRTLGL
jgi:hydroxypyruvate isomerase